MKSFDVTARVPKCSLAKSLELGGAIIWHLAGDVMPDATHPLLDAAQKWR